MLKESLAAYADGATKAVANVETAGTDRSKLEAATEVPEMDAAEKTAMTICGCRGGGVSSLADPSNLCRCPNRSFAS
jgi:hypothetical protein